MTVNKVGAEGAKALSSMLKKNKTLKSLDLSGEEEGKSKEERERKRTNNK